MRLWLRLWLLMLLMMLMLLTLCFRLLEPLVHIQNLLRDHVSGTAAAVSCVGGSTATPFPQACYVLPHFRQCGLHVRSVIVEVDSERVHNRRR